MPNIDEKSFSGAGFKLTKALIESLSDGVALFDKNQKVILINEAMMRITGLPKEGFYISELTNLFKSKVNIQLELDKALQSGKGTFLKEVSILKYYYEMRIIAVKEEALNIEGGAVILHDVTYLKEIDKMKTEFISIASHQLRTPLTAIRWFSQMLASGDAGKLTKSQLDFANEIHSGSTKMVELINALLNVSRLEAGRVKIEPVMTDVVKLIEDVIKDFKQAQVNGKSQIEFIKLNKKSLKIPVDKLVFTQVIENLISNAVRYSDEKTRKIKVRLEENKDGDYMVSVEDNGIGIPAEIQPKLFTKFTRAENAKQKVSEGTGLGLYIVKLMVEAFGGEISFKSTENNGSTFFVKIPKAGMVAKKGEKGLAV